MRYLDNDLVHEHASGRGNSSGLTYAASVTNECGKRAGEGSRATVAVLLHPGSVSRLSGYYSAGVWVFGQQRSRGGAAGPAVGNQPFSTDRVEWSRRWTLPSDPTAGGRICLGRVLCSELACWTTERATGPARYALTDLRLRGSVPELRWTFSLGDIPRQGRDISWRR